MSLKSKALQAFLCFVLGGILSPAQDSDSFSAPPPTEPPIAGKKITSAPAETAAAGTPVLFSIGDPTDDEQFYLELINRARADAFAEANRLLTLDDIYVKAALLKVNTNLMLQQFSTNPAAAPLSFNAKLLTAARNHTKYQFDTGVQTHIGPGTNTLRERLQTVNYIFSWASENVYTYSQNTVHGHAAFEVDWSGDTANGGMQTPPGHRDHIHDRRFTEIGIGVLFGTNQVGGNTPVGPQLVTQDFGTSYPAVTYITGVAYYDLNGNHFYDLGEGLSGATVTVDGVDAYAVTAGSGGYSVPVTPGGNYTVHFKAAGAPDTVTAVNVANTNNVKLDFKPLFALSTVTSTPPTIYATISNKISFSGLPGATGYRTRMFNLRVPAVEGAEGPLTNVTLNISSGYSAISSAVEAAGSNSFHLRHVTDSQTDLAYPQYIQFTNPFWVKPGAKIDFQSRLGVAFGGTNVNKPGEIARLEISTDEGKTWSSIWSQAGNAQDHGPDNSEKTFNARSVALANYTGQLVKLRFNFDVDPTVGWFDQPADKYGWYIDSIAITNADEAVNPTITSLDASAAFQFVPPNAGGYLMQFGAVAGTRIFPFGPWYAATAQPAPPMVDFSPSIAVAGNALSMKITRIAGTVTSITVQSAPDPNGPWTTESNATITGPIADEYTINVPLSGTAKFFRAFAN